MWHKPIPCLSTSFLSSRASWGLSAYYFQSFDFKWYQYTVYKEQMWVSCPKMPPGMLSDVFTSYRGAPKAKYKRNEWKTCYWHHAIRNNASIDTAIETSFKQLKQFSSCIFCKSYKADTWHLSADLRIRIYPVRLFLHLKRNLSHKQLRVFI